jgi:hypothetical protein
MPVFASEKETKGTRCFLLHDNTMIEALMKHFLRANDK